MNSAGDKKMKARTGGEKGRHLLPRLVQKIAEGKTSHELGWKVNVITKTKIENEIIPPSPRALLMEQLFPLAFSLLLEKIIGKRYEVSWNRLTEGNTAGTSGISLRENEKRKNRNKIGNFGTKHSFR